MKEIKEYLERIERMAIEGEAGISGVAREALTKLEGQDEAGVRALHEIADTHFWLRVDERGQEVLCCWPKDNPASKASKALSRLAAPKPEPMRCPSCDCVVDIQGNGHHSVADCIFMRLAKPEPSGEALLPCPFCGGEAHFVDAQHTHAGVDMVVCGKCGCRMYSGTKEKWNTRALLSTQPSEVSHG